MITITDEEIYKEYYKMVFAFLLSMCKDYHLAEDLAQDTFLRAYTHINTYDKNRKMSTWLCEIAKNLYIDHTKKSANKEVPVELFPEDIQKDRFGPHEIDASISAQEIMKIVHRLEDPYKEVFLLRYSMGLSFGEIADIFGEKEGWARMIYYRSRIQLQKKIKEINT